MQVENSQQGLPVTSPVRTNSHTPSMTPIPNGFTILSTEVLHLMREMCTRARRLNNPTRRHIIPPVHLPLLFSCSICCPISCCVCCSLSCSFDSIYAIARSYGPTVPCCVTHGQCCTITSPVSCRTTFTISGTKFCPYTDFPPDVAWFDLRRT